MPEHTDSHLLLGYYKALKAGCVCVALLPHGELHGQQPGSVNNRATIWRNKFWSDKMPALTGQMASSIYLFVLPLIWDVPMKILIFNFPRITK